MTVATPRTTPLPAPRRRTATPTPSPTGFCRFTITAPDSRVDVALPDDLPLADLHPEILRLCAQRPTPHAPVGHHLVRRDGSVLDSARTLADQRVLDGEILALRPFAESLAPPVFDDVSDAVASAVARDRSLWDDRLTRTTGLFAASALLTLLAFCLWNAAPGHQTRGLPGVLAGIAAVLLLSLAAVRTRVYEDQGSAVALGAAALAHAAVAGTALVPPDPGEGPGRVHLLTACAAVLLASVLLVLVAPPTRDAVRGPRAATAAGNSPGGGLGSSGRVPQTGADAAIHASAGASLTPASPTDAPFLATAVASGAGLLLTFLATLADLAPVKAAALGAPLLVAALAFLPGLAARFARLPVGFAPPPTAVGGHDPEPATSQSHAHSDPDTDAHRVATRVRRGHELLTGLLGGCALLAVGCASVLSFSGGVRAQALAFALGLALLLRAHLFRHTAQAACVLAAGLAALLLLGLGLALHPPHTAGASPDLRTLVIAAVTAATAAVVAAIALIVPNKGVTPFWGRFLELAEAGVLLTPVPLCLAVFDAYHALRSAPM
ncbi:type VII secretion integral membrane protein EccD [Streptomyces sp. NPDC091272]|uniref:type VII secretion integral membrane protein EccD n=1 Tax=Streptomyces sp. NPDC091272 TaxID=3365981 RepID=UPI003823E4CC